LWLLLSFQFVIQLFKVSLMNWNRTRAWKFRTIS